MIIVSDTWMADLKPGKKQEKKPTKLNRYLRKNCTKRLKKEDAILLDVRKKSEYDSEHVVDAENTPLDFINESMQQIDKDKKYYVHCASGYRSMVFISTLKARGFDNLADVKEGFSGLKQSGKFELTDYVRPTTLL